MNLRARVWTIAGLGRHGTGVEIGQAVQLAGVLVAVVAGVIATRSGYRRAIRS
jgi:hypothetical protein